MHDWMLLKSVPFPTHSWLCGVVVVTPDWESGCEFKYRNFSFFEREVWSNLSNFKYKIGKTRVFNILKSLFFVPFLFNKSRLESAGILYHSECYTLTLPRPYVRFLLPYVRMWLLDRKDCTLVITHSSVRSINSPPSTSDKCMFGLSQY